MKKRISSKLNSNIADLQNTGLPITTALLIAYELIRNKVNDYDLIRDEENADDTLKAAEIAASIGRLAGTILKQLHATSGLSIYREEPSDPTPGCAGDNDSGNCDPTPGKPPK